MKLLFLQDFHMDAQGGGTYILRRMCGFAPEFGVEYQFVYDLNGEGPYPSSDYPSTAIRTRRRQYRFGLGRLAGLATILGWDVSARRQIRRAIDAFGPDALHVVTHGVSFPLLASEALHTGLPVYLSVHDLWPETVRPYIPRRWAHGLFGRIARKAEKLFVVSDEMGEYLEEQYGLNNWAVVHDGVTKVHPRSHEHTLTDPVRLIYVGMVHSRQMRLLHDLVRNLGHFPEHRFEVHYYTRSPYTPEFCPGNVEIVFHGWVPEEELVRASQEALFGLLPLSFDPADALFYRTSFMTKITFYAGVQLPILCIGPSWASASRVLRENGLGITVEAAHDDAIRQGIRQMLELEADEYATLLDNLHTAATTYLDAFEIARRFYGAMGLEPIGAKARRKRTTK